jgi:hypothetical protein
MRSSSLRLDSWQGGTSVLTLESASELHFLGMATSEPNELRDDIFAYGVCLGQGFSELGPVDFRRRMKVSSSATISHQRWESFIEDGTCSISLTSNS